MAENGHETTADCAGKEAKESGHKMLRAHLARTFEKVTEAQSATQRAAGRRVLA